MGKIRKILKFCIFFKEIIRKIIFFIFWVRDRVRVMVRVRVRVRFELGLGLVYSLAILSKLSSA